MEFYVRTFDELTKDELYRILQLRAEVFVVEQECAYQDVDGKDQKALHVLCQESGKLQAYTRIFKPGDYFEKASIGRVVVDRSSRDKGLGQKIMKKSIDFLVEELSEKEIELSAQTYLLRFYENLGFQSAGDTYLEDGIPHIKMVYQSKF
ncbi:GNAT family N-acetyltransferase [Allomuricauda sp. SCSIO 65647]|uniref:GNAT family N-acetyltransferase n=1 Tax=Allomuricauda sp. SCSIO 65647 TaxID=2908843 RepID=UPI001F1B63B4|nr:GNAT family N-acetyltransferase [Muricauda sp. SCSIO 65647]UJH69092.1 GNAT family N-acetyltransferase [Muricauda sp. SCSIO 65647]